MSKPSRGSHPFLTRLRKLAARWPETKEVETWEHPTFRVGEKIFASYGEHDGEPTFGAKQTKADQAVLLQDPRFFKPSYVGQHGWIGIYADRCEWDVIADLVEQSYRLVAPKRLVKLLDQQR